MEMMSRTIAAYVKLCAYRPLLTILMFLPITLVALSFVASTIKINTDNVDMLSPDLEFRKNSESFKAAFPNTDDVLIIGVEATTRSAAISAARDLKHGLQKEPEYFSDIFAPLLEPNIFENQLLYLEPSELQDMLTRIEALQPFLGRLWRTPNLSGFVDLLEDLNPEDISPETAENLAVLFEKMTANASATGAVLDWSSVLTSSNQTSNLVLIQAKPKLDFSSIAPAHNALAVLEREIAELNLSYSGLTFHVTGAPALETEELQSVQTGLGLAGLISLTLVIGILLVGLRSIRATVAMFVTLLVGLIWTTAIALLIFGELNLISVAFAVLFVGLSVDFGIHFYLRSGEQVGFQDAKPQFVEGARSAGPAILICAISTSVGFFAFSPTDYRGLAELGVIAGIGMFVAFFLNTTLLPALIVLFRDRLSDFSRSATVSARTPKTPPMADKIVLIGAGLATIGAMIFVQDTRFDSDPMSLRNQTASAVTAYNYLIERDVLAPYLAELVVREDQKQPIVTELETLPTVGRVVSLATFIPENQTEKKQRLERAAFLILPAFFLPPGDIATNPAATNDAFSQLLNVTQKFGSLEGLGEKAQALSRAVLLLNPKDYAQVNQRWFETLPGELRQLQQSLSAPGLSLRDLSTAIVARYVAPDGRLRLQVFPVGDSRQSDMRQQFVSEVMLVAPSATGAAIIVEAAREAVVNAFIVAMALATIGVLAVLFWTLPQKRLVCCVAIPVFLAFLWTLAAATMLGIPLNFANIIVLPLIFGLCVDFAIHKVMRGGNAKNGHVAAVRTTNRAIVISGLTTATSFGALALSDHPGTSSMGVLLVLAICAGLVAALVVFPPLIRLFGLEKR